MCSQPRRRIAAPSAGLACALLVALLASSIAHAEEGMWTFDNFPKAAVAKQYGFAPDQAWLDSARRSSVRLAGGCSGSFVSADGLVMTNHHCVRACIAQLSSRSHDYVAGGFYAPERESELRCPEIELNELLSMTDVTARLTASIKGETPGSREAARKEQSEQATIEKECAGGDEKVRCEIVALYHGGIYELYKYRRYQDVRLVFAPEQTVPKFGGDPDNFEFPRWALDAAFLRAWDAGAPAHPEHFFRWSSSGPEENELVFISGNPGTTHRLLTAAEYVYERDVAIPERLFELAEMRGALTLWSHQSAETARVASADLLSIENSYKGLRGRHEALTAPDFMPRKLESEAKLRLAVRKNAALDKSAGGAWDAIAKSVETMRARHKEFNEIEGTSSLLPRAEPLWFGGAKLLRLARLLVRAAAEKQKPAAERLREWGEAKLPAIEQTILSSAPFAKHFEILKLTFGLTRLREQLTPSHPFVKKLLGEKSPEELATQLVENSHLDDLALRKQLYAGGQAAIDASTDPAIVLARALDADGRAMRRWYEDEVAAPQTSAEEAIARARFAISGTNVYPDATFSPRLSYGSVKRVTSAQANMAPFTDFAGAFEHQTGRAPFALPESWNRAKEKLDLALPFDFESDNDIIGGNSGSPVFNQKQEIVGLVFDGNRASLGGDYLYDGSVNRAVSVDSAALVQALGKIYGATRILEELGIQRVGSAAAPK